MGDVCAGAPDPSAAGPSPPPPRSPRRRLPLPDFLQTVNLKHVKLGYHYLITHLLTLLLVPLAAAVLLEALRSDPSDLLLLLLLMAHRRLDLSIDTDADSTTSPKSKPFCFPSCFTPTGTSSSTFKTLGSPTGRSRLSSACASWIADIGGRHPSHHQRKPFLGGGRRRHHSADFRYDAMSYALNFDDGEDGAPRPTDRVFVARLPASPPPEAIGVPPERS